MSENKNIQTKLFANSTLKKNSIDLELLNCYVYTYMFHVGIL